MKPIYLLLSISLILAACASPVDDASQGIEPTATATIPPSPTATIVPSLTSSPTPVVLSMEQIALMSEEEKVEYVKGKGFEGYNIFASNEISDIAILNQGVEYKAYNLITGEVSSLEDVGLAALRLTEVGMTIARGGDRGFLEMGSSVGSDNLLEILLAEGIAPGVDAGDHTDATYVFRKLMQPSNFDNLVRTEGGSSRDIVFNGGYIVFATEVQVSGRNAVIVRYVDGNGNLRIHLVYDTTVEQITSSHRVR
jgi:hypothetical protein